MHKFHVIISPIWPMWVILTFRLKLECRHDKLFIEIIVEVDEVPKIGCQGDDNYALYLMYDQCRLEIPPLQGKRRRLF